MQEPATVTKRRTDWNSVNWQETNQAVRNLRQRIFRATTEGDLKKVRSLQKLMLRSRANALVSVRRVSQQNAGKRTPGVDKLTLKTPTARGEMADRLTTNQPWKAKPVRRVYIPKANGKIRPLGIPVIQDRALQAMVKNALEPHWEAQFEAFSYGFRPGRSQHDALQCIYSLARATGDKRWVVDADIKGAFDNIDHSYLLKTIGNFPGRQQIKGWLRAGVMEEGRFRESLTGTPQGGVISPLLANIALHGMAEALDVRKDRRALGRTINRGIVRYADDFVVFCKTKEDAEKVIGLLGGWLKERGLTLAEEKTRIVHITEGFDFLGFNIRQYPAVTKKKGFKALTRPSKETQQKIRDRLKKEWLHLRGKNVAFALQTLNPIIRGWANYFRKGVSGKVFRKLDTQMFWWERRYAKRTHAKKSKKWIDARYFGKFHPERNDHWVFGNKRTGRYLLKFAWFPIQRHTVVIGRNSPDDPSLKAYWAKRRGQLIPEELPAPSDQEIAGWQDGQCPMCKETLFNGEELHRDHILPRHLGGKDTRNNQQLMHLYCHQQKTVKERSQQK